MQNPKAINSQILGIALPAIATNITVPLLGLCDTAIVGHLGSEAYIGAIAVGTMVFNIMYWLLGVIRMTTSALTAQSYGASDEPSMTAILQRSLAAAVILSALIIIIQTPFLRLSLAIMSPSETVRAHATTYFRICVYAAPAVLAQYALCGAMLGRQNASYALYVALIQHVSNIAISLLLVFVFDMKIEGVALGTLIAQYIGLAAAVWLAKDILSLRDIRRNLNDTGQWSKMTGINIDLFLRTICMVAVTLFFTSAGARQSDTILALNSILMQFFMFFSYFTDGFAFAGEALCGKFWGAQDTAALNRTIVMLIFWGLLIALIFTAIYYLAGELIIGLLTNQSGIIVAAGPYLKYIVIVPLVSFAAFLWDGIMVGLTMTRQLLVTTIVAMLAFVVVYYLKPSADVNTTLWLAFLAYLAARGVIQTAIYVFQRR